MLIGRSATSSGSWYIPADVQYDSGSGGIVKFPSMFCPQALKFTLRLYDSKGIIKNGMKFTHIVYLKQ